MISLDTNVLVRAITRDDPDQAEIAADVLRSGPLLLTKTVLLELEWVLRYSYEFDRPSVNRALTTLAGLENLAIEDPGAVRKALQWHADGMDLADALHLASSTNARVFATFDRKLSAAAARCAASPDIRLL